ncbi:X-ray repair cross-complementing protein 6 isoform X2 [Denticeps clupeoides]|uniref:X-ray repair cross-complementing protein 6 isoform X2 n=1 Tax=Denticeps clupeoides TaxID=299321 RepID=UPI0010A5087F|nr:X-ray repair cross-complementing protein 6 isoform X2 [Denticeps clupeoides]
MAEWNAYYQNEEEEEEQEEGEESAGDSRSRGRDSLVFLVDAAAEMFIKGEDGELSNFDMTMQCVRSVYTSKIISSDQDLIALVFYGTEKSKNPRDSFKNVYIYHDLDSPGARRVHDLDGLRGEEGARLAAETMGSGSTSLGDALWCCSNLYSDIKLRLSHKRLMIFTCRDSPHDGDGVRDRAARTKAADLRETDDESELGLHLEPCGKLDDLQKRVRAKEMKKRTLSRLTLSLGDGMKMAVGVYMLAKTATRPSAVRLYRETNEPIRTKSHMYHTETGSLLLPSDTKRAQVYGRKQIVMEKDEVDEIKKFDDPGLVLIGFKPMSRLKLHHHIRPAVFIYPEEEQVSGSSCVFVALLRRCTERKVFAVCRYIARRNTPPRFLALVPQIEELDPSRAQVTPPGFHGIFLPYADDIRVLDVPECPTASGEQVDKMKQIVQKLRFQYRSDSFENPVLQQHFRNLEALALDLLQPEAIEDFTQPKVEMIDRRLGPLVQEFKDLVYPADYNPEAKAAVKRKPAESGGGADKKPRVEVSEDELRAHVEKGTLGKLTVPVLKDACKQFGVRTTGTRKQELIDAVVAHLSR